MIYRVSKKVKGMPIYEYRCVACGKTFEALYKSCRRNHWESAFIARGRSRS